MPKRHRKRYAIIEMATKQPDGTTVVRQFRARIGVETTMRKLIRNEVGRFREFTDGRTEPISVW